jgi:hypothetical protein
MAHEAEMADPCIAKPPANKFAFVSQPRYLTPVDVAVPTPIARFAPSALYPDLVCNTTFQLRKIYVFEMNTLAGRFGKILLPSRSQNQTSWNPRSNFLACQRYKVTDILWRMMIQYTNRCCFRIKFKDPGKYSPILLMRYPLLPRTGSHVPGL